jgi:predicted phage terminase large subunit-like protein
MANPCPVKFRTSPYIRWGDKGVSAKQEMMLLCDGVEDILYGGAAGGGKSWVVLACALQYADVPGYAALILRKTYQDLSKPGGLLDQAKELLIPQGVRYDAQEKRFRFKEGSSLVFGHLESSDAHLQYQGQEYQCISIDESTQIPERQIRYLHSRLRRLTTSPCPIRFRLASNPGGVSHDYHKSQYIGGQKRGVRIYIPARLEDNLYLDRESYIRQLDYLDPITRSQLLNGDWTARHAGMIFKREWFKIVDPGTVPANCFGHIRAWDLAASESDEAKYTAGVKMCRDCEGNFYVLHVSRFKRTPGARDAVIEQTAKVDGRDTRVQFETEPGSGGLAQVETLRDMLTGYWTDAVKPSGDKFTRAGPFASAAERGIIRIVDGSWTQAYLDELEAANPSEPDDDQYLDQMDASSGAFEWLAKQYDRHVDPNEHKPGRDLDVFDEDEEPQEMDGYKPVGKPMEGFQ